MATALSTRSNVLSAGCRAHRPARVAVRALAQRRDASNTSSTEVVSRRATLSTAAAAILLVANNQKAFAEPACEVLTSPTTGLQWCETEEGTGPSPVKGALIRAHYTGRLVSNGRVFDSSYERGRPLTFRIGAGEVIRGWDLGILGSEADGIPPMKEGGKRKLLIPAELGYGSRGAGGIIPPNSALEFDVELLGKRR